MMSYWYQTVILVVLGSQHILAQVLIQKDLFQTEETSFLPTNWTFDSNLPFNRITSDCQTIFLEIQNSETIKKQYQISGIFQNIRIEMNLYFKNMVDSSVIISINDVQIYSNTFLVNDYDYSILCSSGDAYQYLLSSTYNVPTNSIDYLLLYEIKILYIQSTATSTASLGIRDLLIFIDSPLRENGCPIFTPFLTTYGCTGFCTYFEQLNTNLQYCQQTLSPRNRRISFCPQFVQEAMYQEGYIWKLNRFDESHSSTTQSIFSCTTSTESLESVQVNQNFYLFGTWNNGSYVEITLSSGAEELSLFKVEFNGIEFITSNGAQLYDITLTLPNSTPVMAKQVQALVQGQVADGLNSVNFYQNLIGSTATYAISQIYIVRAARNIGCAKLVLDNYCISCQPPAYASQSQVFAYLGECINKCPIFTIVSTQNTNCTDFQDTETIQFFPHLKKNAIGTYLLIAFNNITFDDTTIDSIFPSNPCIVGNCLNSQRYSQFSERKMFGGFNSWGKGSYSKSWIGLKPHYQIRIQFQLYLIDQWTDSDQFTVSIDGIPFAQESILGLTGSQIAGGSELDYTKSIIYRVPHTDPTLLIEFLCIDPTVGDASVASCGMTDLFIILDEDVLTVCPGSSQYYSYYTKSCRPCDSGCTLGCVLFETNCICNYTCLSCSPKSTSCDTCPDNETSHRTMKNGNECLCDDGFRDDGLNQNCVAICDPVCLTCLASDGNLCTSCDDALNRTDGGNQNCICQKGYQEISGNCQQITPCHVSCLLCSLESSSNSCVSCPNPLTTHRIPGIDNNCLCEINYTEQLNEANCSPICHYSCLTCLMPLLGNSCLSCNESDFHRILNQNNECVCDPRYSEIADQLICAPICHQNCSTCFGIFENQCLTCNESNHRYLNNGFCQCEKYYWDVDGQLECIPCDLQDGWQSTKCIKIDCNDGVYTHGEDCDDGNFNPRDGCLNCKLQKGFFCNNTPLQQSVCIKCGLNCEKCNKEGECTACQSGYEINSSGFCISCPQNCETCYNHKCLKCMIVPNLSFTGLDKDCPICEDQPGAYSDPVDRNYCQAKCGDLITLKEFEECDDGNTLDSDGCSSTCKIEKRFNCLENICVQSEAAPHPILTSVVPTDNYTNFRNYYLNYSTFILNDEVIIERISIQIQNRTKDVDYQLNITEIILEQDSNDYCNYSLTIQLQLLQTFEAKLIEIKFTDISSIIGLNGLAQEISDTQEPIYDYYYKSETLIKASKNVNSVNQIMLYILFGMVGLGVLIGGLDTFWNLLDLVQLLSYINFIDTRYPYNLSKFLKLFEFGQLRFLDNIIKIQSLITMYIDSSEFHLYSAKGIFYKQVDSSLFFINCSSTITAFLIVTGIYFIFFTINKLLLKFKLSQYFLSYFNPRPLNKSNSFRKQIFQIMNQILQYTKKYCNCFFWNVIIRTHMSIAYDISFAIFLQFQLNYSDMKTLLPKFSYCTSLFALLVQGIAIYFYLSKLNITKAQFKQQNFQKKYGEALFENLKHNNIGSIRTYYNVFLISKRIIYMAVLIAVSEVPQLQTVCMSILGSIHISFLLLKRPLDSTSEFVKQLQSEILMLFMHLQICLLTIDDCIHLFSEDGRMLIGWICVGEICLIIAIQLIIDISQQMIYLYYNFKGIRTIINYFRNKCSKSKNDNISPQLFF